MRVEPFTEAFAVVPNSIYVMFLLSVLSFLAVIISCFTILRVGRHDDGKTNNIFFILKSFKFVRKLHIDLLFKN